MADRRKLSLCYNYYEPYVRGHRCSHLFYLEVSDYVVEPDDDEEPATPAEPAAFDPGAGVIVANGDHCGQWRSRGVPRSCS